MTKNAEQIYKELETEFKMNDKLVKKNSKGKSDIEKSKEFASFIKTNKCKTIGGKNGKK